MLEARFEAATKGNRTFSVQQLVNCVPNPQECGGSGGCEGATVELAMEYVQSMGLADAETSPYYARQTHCKTPQSGNSGASAAFLAIGHGRGRNRFGTDGGNKVGLRRWNKLPENRALPLMRSVMDGPVAVSVAASEWFLYRSGIFDSCSKDAVIDHAVVLFGYGSDNGAKYWLVRNSWGKDWGEGGYIRLFRHDTVEEDDEHCGIDNDPKSGVACKPYPKAVTVCGMCGLLYDSVAAHFV